MRFARGLSADAFASDQLRTDGGQLFRHHVFTLLQDMSHRQEAHQRIGYPLAAQRWQGSGSAVVLDESGQQLLVFPVEFLQRGNVDTVAFVLHCVSMAFVVESGSLRSESGSKQSPSDKVKAGRFVFYRESQWSKEVLE